MPTPVASSSIFTPRPQLAAWSLRTPESRTQPRTGVEPGDPQHEAEGWTRCPRGRENTQVAASDSHSSVDAPPIGTSAKVPRRKPLADQTYFVPRRAGHGCVVPPGSSVCVCRSRLSARIGAAKKAEAHRPGWWRARRDIPGPVNGPAAAAVEVIKGRAFGSRPPTLQPSQLDLFENTRVVVHSAAMVVYRSEGARG